MKTNKFIYILLSILILASSCTKLERMDYHRIEEDNFFKTEADCRAAVTDLYSEGMVMWFAPAMDHPGAISDLASDHVEFGWNSAWGYDISNFLYTADDSKYWNLSARYKILVQTVSKATSLIPRLEKVPMNEEVRNRYIAEVRAMRCNAIFWGADLYNGISIMDDPMVLEDASGAEHFKPRATPEESLAFVVKEVDEIKDQLEVKYMDGDADYGRFTKGAVLTIKLKMQMQMRKFADAIQTAEEIASCGYSLVPVYSDIFSIKNERHNETILSYPCVANITPGNQFQSHWLPRDYVSSNPATTKWAVYKLSWDLVDKFDLEDTRFAEIVTEYKNTSGVLIPRGEKALEFGAFVIKYDEDPESTGHKHGNDMIMFRYGDVLLLWAEAINEVNGPTQEAIDLINKVRERAFQNNPDKLLKLTDYAGNKELLREAILLEREFELFAEYSRRQDLIRHNKFHEYAYKKNPNYNEGQMYFPIPNWIVDQSGGIIKQNPGY